MKYYGRCLTTYHDPAYHGGRRKCSGRRMLSMRPDEYVRPPRCPHCNGTKWYLDTNIIRRHRAERCNCGGWHFTHRRGSKGCYYSKTVEQDMSERYEG